MIQIRFRFVDGTAAPCLSPLATATTFTITKEGVLFFRKDGSRLHFYPNDRLCEVQDEVLRYVHTEEELDGIKLHKWTTKGKEIGKPCGLSKPHEPIRTPGIPYMGAQ